MLGIAAGTEHLVQRKAAGFGHIPSLGSAYGISVRSSGIFITIHIKTGGAIGLIGNHTIGLRFVNRHGEIVSYSISILPYRLTIKLALNTVPVKLRQLPVISIDPLRRVPWPMKHRVFDAIAQHGLPIIFHNILHPCGAYGPISAHLRHLIASYAATIAWVPGILEQ